MATVLIVDDDDQVRRVLVRTLESGGHETVAASNGREALALAGQRSFDCVVTDILMPDIEGLETITRLREICPKVPIIAMSGGGRIDGQLCLELASSLGATSTLQKPIWRDDLLTAVEAALR